MPKMASSITMSDSRNRGGEQEYPQVLAVESSTDFSYAAVNLTATYQMPVPYTYLGNLAAGYTVREFLFIKPLNTLFIIDRLQSTFLECDPVIPAPHARKSNDC